MQTLALDPTQDPGQDVALHPPHEHKRITAPSAFRLEVDGDGIAWLTFDSPGSGANVFNEDALRELDDSLEAVENDLAAKALVIRSGKEKIFVAGADLKSIKSLTSEKLGAFIELGQSVFSRLAALPIPKVAAIHGACVGGGLEMALACDVRIASDADATRLGQPEVQLGIIPGWGGCTRLPRLLGLPKALDLILTGKLLKPDHARKLGLVDEVIPREHLQATARRWCKAPVRHHRMSKLEACSAWFPLRQFIAWKARKDLIAKTRGLYPAPLKALEVTIDGISQSIDDSLRLEREAILSLAKSPHASKLIELFFRKEDASKKLPATGSPVQVTHAAVIGAGVMGAGIAQWLASRGISVLMSDISPDAIAKGISKISGLFAEGVKRRAISKREGREGMDRIAATSSPVPLSRQQIVIEAATESFDLKKKIFASLAERCSSGTILATNTSALSITELAKSVPHPERVIGIHFFNPVHRMPLVEIITHSGSTPDVIATAVAFSQRLGKTPVVVKDSPGFVVNRILMPCLLEAVRMVESGVNAADIDESMLEFGMPMGPLRLLDEIGLDVAIHVGQTLIAAFPDRLAKSALLDRLVAEGKLGKKTGHGFYRHVQGKAEESKGAVSADIQKKLAMLIGEEAKRCLNEGVAASAADIDLAMVLGTGYPPFRGGPLAWLDSVSDKPA